MAHSHENTLTRPFLMFHLLKSVFRRYTESKCFIINLTSPLRQTATFAIKPFETEVTERGWKNVKISAKTFSVRNESYVGNFPSVLFTCMLIYYLRRFSFTSNAKNKQRTIYVIQGVKVSRMSANKNVELCSSGTI